MLIYFQRLTGLINLILLHLDFETAGNERNPILDKLFRPLGLSDQERPTS